MSAILGIDHLKKKKKKKIIYIMNVLAYRYET